MENNHIEMDLDDQERDWDEILRILGIPEESAARKARRYGLIHGVQGEVCGADGAVFITDDFRPTTETSPENILLLSERREALGTALSGLSDRDILIVFGHFYEGKTLTVVAQELGISTSAVSKREKRFLLRLRQELNESELFSAKDLTILPPLK